MIRTTDIPFAAYLRMNDCAMEGIGTRYDRRTEYTFKTSATHREQMAIEMINSGVVIFDSFVRQFRSLRDIGVGIASRNGQFGTTELGLAAYLRMKGHDLAGWSRGRETYVYFDLSQEEGERFSLEYLNSMFAKFYGSMRELSKLKHEAINA